MLVVHGRSVREVGFSYADNKNKTRRTYLHVGQETAKHDLCTPTLLLDPCGLEVNHLPLEQPPPPPPPQIFPIFPRSNYLYDQLADYIDRFPNVMLTSWRLPTIWGATNLYEVYLRGIADLLPYEWDYFVNLSGADLPLLGVDDLANYLQMGRSEGLSFLETHGQDHTGYIKRQGLDQ